MKNIVHVMFLLFLVVSFNQDVYSKTFYVSLTGRANASGSQTDPIGWEYFQNTFDKSGGGNTFIFKPGVYLGKQITIKPEQKGSPQNPTVLKSEVRYKANLHGSAWHNIYINKGADWVIIEGFASSGAIFAGIKSSADHTVIRYCWIFNNSLGVAAHNVKGSVFENNLIEFNGRHIQFDHGIYADGNSIIFRNNIVRFNASFGLHLYPLLSKSRIENNLIYGNNRAGITIFEDGSNGENTIVNNTIVRNGSGIILNKSYKDVIYNNIISENKSTWRWVNENENGLLAEDITINDSNDTNSLKIDYNLCDNKNKNCGSHTIVADPLFLNKMKGLFYLKKDSPAVGKGSQVYYAEKDILGKIRKANSIDLGCFAFDSFLLNDEYRKDWYLGWPYYFKNKNAESEIPFLWKNTNEH